MTQLTSVHLEKDDNYTATVSRSSDGTVWIHLGNLTIFCTPEQALKLASDINDGMTSLPTLEEAKAREEELKKICPF